MNRISLLAAMLVVGASVQVVSAAEAAKETATQPFGGATGGVIKRAETAAQPFGGATGGGSSITQDGLDWTARYRRLERELSAALLEIQRKEFN